MTEQFLPFLYSSQPCEEFFRQIRSFTSTYSTKANCSVKEILGRINKIQLMNDIVINSNFEFPRVKNSINFPNRKFHDLPTKEEIFVQIERCHQNAIQDAIKLRLIEKNYDKECGTCQLPPIRIKSHEEKTKEKTNVNTTLHKFIAPKNICLTNFLNKFVGQTIDETSHVEAPMQNPNRMIVKKTSLCWLLRPEQSKLSSDRILRVRGGMKIKDKKNEKNKTKKQNKPNKRKKKHGLIYNPYK